ncbi:transcriptional regulation of mitochondrial recombination-domain-containing protein [Tricharina praecox]|uniref:transcriptional regulation of mitochondrial recombination-domain-containing protein n=1 Tax=Tricharina praecox TaxID=43433 RepID=UPI00221E82DD|nr:transcriptional regulation of mitochondrial recombination-domain-containing protein [Tricharina praecox]KAI5853534.1 transcriptional regulation of mitochondrial recombination-domain-containing protein [Tricharina praecox]
MVRPVKNVANHGRTIFIYNNIHTNQVVYSLTRTLNNNDALKQLPFIAKKTVPAALRKDHWSPLATVSFPEPALGLKTYHKLREFRKLHETQYDPVLLEMPKKERKYVIMNQKANSIADLAESLRIEIARSASEGVAIKNGDVMVRWRDMLDTQYAAEWPELVGHADQGRSDRPYMAPKVELPKVEAVPEADAPKEEAVTV